MDITFTTVMKQIAKNCMETRIGEPWAYGFANGSRIVTALWNDELSILLEDGEGFEIESQILDFNKITEEDLEQSVGYLLRCADGHMAA